MVLADGSPGAAPAVVEAKSASAVVEARAAPAEAEARLASAVVEARAAPAVVDQGQHQVYTLPLLRLE